MGAYLKLGMDWFPMLPVGGESGNKEGNSIFIGQFFMCSEGMSTIYKGYLGYSLFSNSMAWFQKLIWLRYLWSEIGTNVLV